MLDNQTSTVAAMYAPRDTEDTRSRGVEILAGDLFEISLASLLFLVQYEAINGWLTVARRGVITLNKGHIAAVRCGSLRGHDGLRELLFHRGGHFTIVRGELVASEGPAVNNPTFAMMDAYRLRDEWNRLAPQVLRVPAARPWQATSSPLAATVAQFDGRRSVAEALRSQDGALSPLIDPLLEALAAGLLERSSSSGGAPPPPASPAPAAHGDFYELVERGRDCVRRGDYKVAHDLLTQALALRPDDRVVQQNLRALVQRLRQP